MIVFSNQPLRFSLFSPVPSEQWFSSCQDPSPITPSSVSPNTELNTFTESGPNFLVLNGVPHRLLRNISLVLSHSLPSVSSSLESFLSPVSLSLPSFRPLPPCLAVKADGV